MRRGRNGGADARLATLVAAARPVLLRQVFAGVLANCKVALFEQLPLVIGTCVTASW